MTKVFFLLCRQPPRPLGTPPVRGEICPDVSGLPDGIGLRDCFRATKKRDPKASFFYICTIMNYLETTSNVFILLTNGVPPFSDANAIKAARLAQVCVASVTYSTLNKSKSYDGFVMSQSKTYVTITSLSQFNNSSSF
ncbi:hypothetical protein J5751_05720 [bacterium]|nr:hypothetical protein [bacterium]